MRRPAGIQDVGRAGGGVTFELKVGMKVKAGKAICKESLRNKKKYRDQKSV